MFIAALIGACALFLAREPNLPPPAPQPVISHIHEATTAKTPEPAPTPALATTPEPPAEPEPPTTLPAVVSDHVEAAALPESAPATPSVISQPVGAEDGDRFVRFLDEPPETEAKFLFFHADPTGADRSIAVGKLRGGYGQIFRDDSLVVRTSNGTAWEEPSWLYVKATFRF